jgi:toxin ParE1/3/4
VSRVILLPEAREDVLEAFGWYEKERRGLGKVFRAALNQAIRRIRTTPFAAQIVYRDLRRVIVQRFPYGVFYRVMPQAIVVVAVVHGHRAPTAWMRRA